MKKIVTLFVLVLTLMCTATVAFAESIAIVPYLDTTEQKKEKDYLPGFMTTYYTDAMSNLGLTVIPASDVEKALQASGYDVSNQMIADKDILAEVANATGADYVVATELSALNVENHMSLFQIKITVNAKLRYNFYVKKANRVTAFQVTGSDENKAVIGGVGAKSPTNNALKQATEKANEKIKGMIAANNDVVIKQ